MKDKFENVQDIFPCTVERGRPMIRIIICDDDDVFLNKLQHAIEVALQRMDISAKIHTFNSMEKIGQPIFASCDIAFLDIDFAHTRYNGLDIARTLRKVRKDAIIIFVTNFIEYAPEGYEVQAFRYVLKIDIEKKLQEYLIKEDTKMKKFLSLILAVVMIMAMTIPVFAAAEDEVAPCAVTCTSHTVNNPIHTEYDLTIKMPVIHIIGKFQRVGAHLRLKVMVI